MARSLTRQRGAALILLAALFVLGGIWFFLDALAKGSPTSADRDVKTGLALQGAKQALLGYAAHYAARTSGAGSNEPGQLPCPELPNSIGTASEGAAASSCSNITPEIGRLPWRTLGVDALRDGDGEPLWYVLSPGFRSAPINFGTPGQLAFEGNPVVALIIAPGKALNTLSDPDTPPSGCTKVNQQGNRYESPLAPAKFFECGNLSGSYASLGTSQWSNDRVIAITSAEWADAIGGAIGDRLQRQVAPALTEWRTTQSNANWGVSFLPYASAFSQPGSNDYCGNLGVTEGLPPIASASSGGCSTAWQVGTGSLLVGLLNIDLNPGAGTCVQTGTAMRCQVFSLLFLPALLSARITVTAPNVASSFRAKLSAADITVSHGGSATNLVHSINGAGEGVLRFDITVPPVVLQTITVEIRNLADAPVLSDSRLTWFLDNEWSRYTYYAVSPAVTAAPGMACASPGDPGCIVVSGLPASTGNANDKTVALALMGRALVPQLCSVDSDTDGVLDCDDRDRYLESRTSALAFSSAVVTSTWNDRIAVCPFELMPESGTASVICN